LDEINKAGYQRATDEADPISLAEERTDTFANRLILLLSTPTTETGRITRELNSCDVIYDWHVPCPHCGQMQPLRWSLKYASGCEDGQYRAEDGTWHQIGGVLWDGGREATREQIDAAAYQCGECGCLWSTVEKNQAVQQGRMVPRAEVPEGARKIGFDVNRLYSLFPGGRLENLVSKWLAAVNSGDMKQIQGFVNSSLAEPWKQVTVEASESAILKAKVDLPPQTVPDEAVVLTCGIDNQRYGFWHVVRAWARDFTNWLIDYGFLAAWDDVENLLFETAYPRQNGGTLPIWRAGIDTGGGQFEEGMSMTEEVYWWVRQNGVGRGARVWATKGASSPLVGKIKAGKPLDKTPGGKPIPGGLQIISLDTDKLKDTYHYRLSQAIKGDGEPQSAYLHAETGEDYARQIRAEEKQIDRKGIESWVHVRGENHLFDCEVIAHALVDPEWPGGGLNLYRESQEIQGTLRKQQPMRRQRW
jgi:phage terminase large subunit GpA-like protein